MSPTSGATIRAALPTVVEEGAGADRLFIGEAVCPQVPMDAKSGTYPKVQIKLGQLLTKASTLRERGSSYGKISQEWTSDTYDCLDRGLEESVDDTDVKDKDKFPDLIASTKRWVQRNMRIDHEVRAAAIAMSASNYGAGTNSVVAYTIANLTTIDFALDVSLAIERVLALGEVPNTIIMSNTVALRLKSSTKLQNYCRGALPNDATLQLSAAAIQGAFADQGIEHVLIGRLQYNTAKQGATVVMSNVWGTTYVWVGATNPSPGAGSAGLMNVGAQATLVWNAEGGIWVTETYRNEENRSTIVRVRQNTVEKCINGNAGTLITTQYA